MRKILLVLIFFLAFILRFWQLGQNPPSLDWDEASLGYNAYSILKTGRDEYGTFLPLAIRSFNDYKPPLYTYLTVIPVAMFGLSEFSTRFVSAFLGLLSVIVGFYLVKELFPGKKRIYYLLFTFFFAVSPWHIQFSRIAFEANSALFFVLCGIWLFLKGLRKNIFFLPAFLSFSLSAYAYHSERLVVPLIIVGLIFFYRQELKDKRIWVMAGLLIFIILFLPILQQMRATSARFGSVTVLNPDEKLGKSIQAVEYDKRNDDRLGILTHNRRIVYGREVLGGYLDHFDFDFLFLKGDPPGRHHAAGMGMLYFWDLPFIILGLYFMIVRHDKGKYLLFFWFLVAPIASSVTAGTPHAVRALMYLPIYQIFITTGIIGIIGIIGRLFGKIKKRTMVTLVFLLFLINFFYYLHMYYIHTPVEYSQSWQYGYKQVVQEVSKYEKNYNKVLVTYKYDQPYIFFLFYQQIDPAWYQKNWGGGEVMRENRSFGKYEFRNIDWAKDSQMSNVLLVGTPKEIPQDTAGMIKQINFLDKTAAFIIAAR